MLWLTLPGFLLIVTTAANWKHTVALGWLFGFGHFATGFAWITNAFFVDRETFAALAVPAVGALAAGFAFYISVCALLVWLLKPRDTNGAPPHLDRRAGPLALHVLVFAAVWTLVEWWRGWFLTGFPWNPVGSVWTAHLTVLQGAGVFGVYGLGLFTVIAAGSLVFAGAAAHRNVIAALLALFHLPIGLFAVAGYFVLEGEDPDDVPGVVLRLVQPNIAQSDKWRPEERAQHVYDQVAMSTQDAEAITHVLWAETAVPFALNSADEARAVVASASPPGGLVLTGAPRLVTANGTRQVFNSLFVVTPDGTSDAAYDKTHLVPFGEYMPLSEYIPIPQLTGGSGFSPGPGAVTLALDGLPPVSPSICYEIVYSGDVTEAGNRPEWLFNLTNDAWFGDSSGPYQHLAAARLRAVEEGLPLIRVANTGISAVIDSRGRILKSLPLNTKGVLDHPLPGALPETIFARYGHLPVLLISIVLVAAAGYRAHLMSKIAKNRRNQGNL